MIRKHSFLEAVGIIGGMIIGSGMFALPFAVTVSGIFAAALSSVAAFIFVLLIHLAYGEIVVNSGGHMRLPGYSKHYLGNWQGQMSKLSQLLSFNTGLLIYGILGGVFLSAILGGSALYWSLAFFVFGSGILFFRSIEEIGFLNFVLCVPLVAVTLLISFFALRAGNIANLSLPGTDPFFSFGVFVFSFAGLSVIADARDIFKNRGDEYQLKNAIMLGTALPYFLYAVFIMGVLMAVGSAVSPDSISGLAPVLGTWAVKLGAVVGFIAVFTSYLAMGYDLKEIYELDLGFGKIWSGLAVFLLPLAVFMLDFTDFVKLISVAGGLFLTMDAFFVIFILKRVRAEGAPGAMRFLSFGYAEQLFLFTIAFASIAYEVVYQILGVA